MGAWCHHTHRSKCSTSRPTQVPLVVGGVLELQLLLSARPHRTFSRRGEHLTAHRHVPVWHNWRKPPVFMRAICGTRVRLRQRGEAVPRGGVSCTVRLQDTGTRMQTLLSSHPPCDTLLPATPYFLQHPATGRWLATACR